MMRKVCSRWAKWAIATAAAVGVPSAANAALIGWNFSDDNGIYDTGTPVDFAVSSFSIGNTLGTVTDPILSQSVSSGYGGASGTFNIGNAAKIGALDTAVGGSAYFEVTFTPDPGYKIEVTDFDFGSRSTATGAQAYSLIADAMTYATGTIANNGTWAYKDNAVTTITGGDDLPLVLRLYVHGGTGSPAAGTINTRLDDIGITVSAVEVPEPTGLAVLGAGGLLALRRKRLVR